MDLVTAVELMLFFAAARAAVRVISFIFGLSFFVLKVAWDKVTVFRI
jgi:hypothetical protein